MNPSFPSHRRICIFAIFLFLTPLVVSSAHRIVQQSSTHVEDWLPDAFEETKILHWFQEHFVSDDLLMISWEGCTFDDKRLVQLADKLRQPVDIGDLRQVEFCRRIVTGPEVLQSLREQPLQLSRRNALARLRGWLAGDDLQSTCLVLMLTETGWEHRRYLLDHIRATAATIEGLDPKSLHMAGRTLDSVAIDQATQEGLHLMMIASYAVGGLLMAIMFRSVTLTIAVFLTASFCQQMSLTIVEYSGGHIDSVMLMIPSLVFVLSISAGVHLVNYYREAIRDHGLQGAARVAVRHALLPGGLAAVTTALGLGSLGVSFLTPVKNFGLYSAVGVMLSTLVVFILLPALVEEFVTLAGNKKATKFEVAQTRSWSRLQDWVVGRSTQIILVAIIVLAASAWGVTQIRTSAGVAELFPKDATLLRDYAWIENKIGPLVPLEVIVVIPTETEMPASLLDRLRVVGAIHAVISANEGIGAVVSPLSISPQIGRRGRGGRSVVRQTMLNQQLELKRTVFIENAMLRETATEELWRVSARAFAGKGLNYTTLLEEIEKSVEPILLRSKSLGMGNVRAVYSGGVPITQKAQHQMMQDLIHSFSLAFALITAMMIGLALFGSKDEFTGLAGLSQTCQFVIRRVAAGLISMIPNLMPCVAVLGCMGLLGVQLEIGSIMTASVALGIAVDDTLHFITWFRRGLARGMGRAEAVQFAYTWCATAMTQTSLVCGFGLLMFAFSSFVPISRFAWVMFSMLMTALVADLVVLPAILLSPLGKVFELIPGTPRHRSPEPSP